MLSSPIEIDFGDGNVTFNRINQDGYSSEYLARTATMETRLKFRNTVTGKAPNQVERHGVELLRIVYANGVTPEKRFQAFYTFVSPKGVDVAEAVKLMVGLETLAGPTYTQQLANFAS